MKKIGIAVFFIFLNLILYFTLFLISPSIKKPSINIKGDIAVINSAIALFKSENNRNIHTDKFEKILVPKYIRSIPIAEINNKIYEYNYRLINDSYVISCETPFGVVGYNETNHDFYGFNETVLKGLNNKFHSERKSFLFKYFLIPNIVFIILFSIIFFIKSKINFVV